MILSSCFGSTGLNIILDVTCEEFEKKSPNLENEFEIELHDKITLKMCANPSTGFGWSYTMLQTGVMELESREYVAPEDGLVGSAGLDVWTFKSIKAGTTEIKMEYSKGTETEWTYSMKVTVE